MEYLLSYRKDKEFAETCMIFLQDFNLGKDMGLYIATKEQAIKADMPSYLISDFNIVYDNPMYKTYTKTIDQMRQAASDFRKGWIAAQKANGKK